MVIRHPLGYLLLAALLAGSIALLWPSREDIEALRLQSAIAEGRDPEDALAQLRKVGRERSLTAAERSIAKRTALALGKPKEALALLDAPHSDPASYSELVDLACLAGNLKVACKYQKLLAKQRSASLPVWNRLRTIALAAGDVDTAVLAQQRLCFLSPGPREQERLGELYLKAGKTELALDAYAASPHPDSLDWHRRMAQLAEWAERPGRAIPHLRAVYQRTGEFPVGKRLLAITLNQGDPSCLTAFPRLLVASRDEASRKELAFLVLRHRSLPELLEGYRKALSLAPHEKGLHREFVQFALAHQKREPAIAELQRWIARFPGDEEETHRLAVVLNWDGRRQEAWNTYRRLFSSDSTRAFPWKEEATP